LDLSHYEAGVATIPEALMDYTFNGRVQGRIANRHPSRAPQGVYPCAGEDRWVAISVADSGQLRALAGIMGRAAIGDDARFATMATRRAHHDLLDEMIGAWTRERTAEDVVRQLQGAGIEAAAVATPRDVWTDEQLRHRGFFEMVPPPASAPEIGARPHLRPAWRMSVSPATTRRRAPEFGEHTDEVLAEYLQITAEEIAALEEIGVIARAPRPGLIARPGPMDLETLVRSGRMQEVDAEYRRRLERAVPAEAGPRSERS
jgi:benzylsuccinate CoA-transferase BbsF subunit